MKKYLIIVALATMGSSFLAPGLLGLFGWADEVKRTSATSDAPWGRATGPSARVAVRAARPTVLTAQAPEAAPRGAQKSMGWMRNGPELPSVVAADGTTHQAPGSLPSQTADPVESLRSRAGGPAIAAPADGRGQSLYQRHPVMGAGLQSPVAGVGQRGIVQRLPAAPAVEPVAVQVQSEPYAPGVGRQWLATDKNAERPDRATPTPVDRAMEAVNRRADELVRRGFQQADRRMLYTARMEFISALEVVARALDQTSDSQHSAALAAGLRALEEADSFVPHGLALATEINIELLVASHRTPVLKATAARATALDALQQYYTYAQEQLAASVKSSPSGSMALYGLGKLYAEIAKEPQSRILDPQPKVMVFHQAALIVNPGNWRAANELGVLLARGGRYEEARDWLRHSTAVKPTRESLNNLAKIYRVLGQGPESVAAQRRALAAAPGTSFDQEPASPVVWVNATTFVAANAEVSSQTPDATPSGVAPRPSVETAVTQSKEQAAKTNGDGGKRWFLPWKAWK